MNTAAAPSCSAPVVGPDVLAVEVSRQLLGAHDAWNRRRRFLCPASASGPMAVVAAHGAGLVPTTPARPVQHRLRRGQDAHDQPIDQSTDFRDGEGD